MTGSSCVEGAEAVSGVTGKGCCLHERGSRAGGMGCRAFASSAGPSAPSPDCSSDGTVVGRPRAVPRGGSRLTPQFAKIVVFENNYRLTRTSQK